jgi:hypothetical protein
MPDFVVPFVREDLQHEWIGYNSKRQSEFAKNAALLGRTDIVRAKDKAEAAAKIEAKYPGHVAMRSDISRVRT